MPSSRRGARETRISCTPSEEDCGKREAAEGTSSSSRLALVYASSIEYKLTVSKAVGKMWFVEAACRLFKMDGMVLWEVVETERKKFNQGMRLINVSTRSILVQWHSQRAPVPSPWRWFTQRVRRCTFRNLWQSGCSQMGTHSGTLVRLQ